MAITPLYQELWLLTKTQNTKAILATCFMVNLLKALSRISSALIAAGYDILAIKASSACVSEIRKLPLIQVSSLRVLFL